VTAEHEHKHGEEDSIDVSGWARSAEKRSCPACGAPGALFLGGGLFCPSCGEVTTNPGYGSPKQSE
jgi:ribosomal protein S27AE